MNYNTWTASNRNKIWDHEDHLRRAVIKRGLATIGQAYEHKTIEKKVYVGDKVMTPNGKGRVRVIDEDDTICVELDPESNILHEFNRNEVAIYKKDKKKKKRK